MRFSNARTGMMILVLRPGIGSILSVAFSPDRSRLAYGHDTVGVGEISGLRKRQSLQGHAYEVPDVAFHQVKPWLVSGSANHEIHLWDAQSGGRRGGSAASGGGGRSSAGDEPRGRPLAGGRAARRLLTRLSVRLWGLDEGPPASPWLGNSTPSPPWPSTRRGPARLGGRGRAVIVWDVRSRQEVWRVRPTRPPSGRCSSSTGGIDYSWGGGAAGSPSTT